MFKVLIFCIENFALFGISQILQILEYFFANRKKFPHVPWNFHSELQVCRPEYSALPLPPSRKNWGTEQFRPFRTELANGDVYALWGCIDEYFRFDRV